MESNQLVLLESNTGCAAIEGCTVYAIQATELCRHFQLIVCESSRTLLVLNIRNIPPSPLFRCTPPPEAHKP